MIYLHSGRPGSGKTLSAIERGMEWVAEGRTVYALNVNGLDHVATGIKPYRGRLEDWATTLKAGDALLVDEIQFFVRKGSLVRSVPDWVEELTRNRHAGVDFLWTTQDPKNLDPFLRRLINEHRHYVNKNGAPSAIVYRWPNGNDEPEEQGQMDRAERYSWDYPINLYNVYKSAQLHTRKRHIPRKVKVLVAAVVICLCLAAFGWMYAKRTFSGTAPRSGAVPQSSASKSGLLSGMPGESKTREAISTKDWIKAQIPRVPAMPWSAPIFDDRKVASHPDIYCVGMLEQNVCQCYTEQMTRLGGITFNECRDIALHGVYNPFREPRQLAQVSAYQPQRPQSVESPRVNAGDSSADVQGAPVSGPPPAGIQIPSGVRPVFRGAGAVESAQSPQRAH